MKVLMFGWEFPPHILGGLGTASYGLTKGVCLSNVTWRFRSAYQSLGVMKTRASCASSA